MQDKGRILIVDDEARARTGLAESLREGGFAVETATDGSQALREIQENPPDLMLTDLVMPGIGGLELVEQARAADEDLVVLAMTAAGEPSSGVEAMRRGAADYLAKPVDMSELVLLVERELEVRRRRREVRGLRARLAERCHFNDIIGSAPGMQRLLKAVAQVAASTASVLITGEPGTGKALIAAAIHRRSPQAAGSFVKVRCASLAKSVLESELFRCQGGTLFLEELDEISLALQGTLLRFLQAQESEQAGDHRTGRLGVRLVGATSRNLDAELAAGGYRGDLHRRLNVVTLHVPALRERASDIPLLLGHFVAEYAAENGVSRLGFDAAALERLCGYSWPGNVTELQSVVERAVVLAAGPRMTASDLPAHVRPAPVLGDIQIPGSSMEEIERHAIVRTLEATGGSSVKAAEILGISVRKVQYKRQQYRPSA